MNHIKKTVITLLWLVIICSMPVSVEAQKSETSKDTKQSILMEIQVKSQRGDQTKEFHPKVLTLNNHTAAIAIEGGKTKLNQKDVYADDKVGQAYENKLFSLEILPKIIEGSNPQEISLSVKLFFQDSDNAVISNNYSFNSLEGRPFTFTAEDPAQKTKLQVSITPSLYKGQFDKK